MYSLKSEVLCLALKILNTTSSDVISEPSENFTPFDDVTEDQCIKWVEDKWTSVDMAKKGIEGQIESKINPMFKPVEAPWSEPMIDNTPPTE